MWNPIFKNTYSHHLILRRTRETQGFPILCQQWMKILIFLHDGLKSLTFFFENFVLGDLSHVQRRQRALKDSTSRVLVEKNTHLSLSLSLSLSLFEFKNQKIFVNLWICIWVFENSENLYSLSLSCWIFVCIFFFWKTAKPSSSFFWVLAVCVIMIILLWSVSLLAACRIDE